MLRTFMILCGLFTLFLSMFFAFSRGDENLDLVLSQVNNEFIVFEQDNPKDVLWRLENVSTDWNIAGWHDERLLFIEPTHGLQYIDLMRQFPHPVPNAYSNETRNLSVIVHSSARYFYLTDEQRILDIDTLQQSPVLRLRGANRPFWFDDMMCFRNDLSGTRDPQPDRIDCVDMERQHTLFEVDGSIDMLRTYGDLQTPDNLATLYIVNTQSDDEGTATHRLLRYTSAMTSPEIIAVGCETPLYLSSFPTDDYFWCLEGDTLHRYDRNESTPLEPSYSIENVNNTHTQHFNGTNGYVIWSADQRHLAFDTSDGVLYRWEISAETPMPVTDEPVQTYFFDADNILQFRTEDQAPYEISSFSTEGTLTTVKLNGENTFSTKNGVYSINANSTLSWTPANGSPIVLLKDISTITQSTDGTGLAVMDQNYQLYFYDANGNVTTGPGLPTAISNETILLEWNEQRFRAVRMSSAGFVDSFVMNQTEDPANGVLSQEYLVDTVNGPSGQGNIDLYQPKVSKLPINLTGLALLGIIISGIGVSSGWRKR